MKTLQWIFAAVFMAFALLCFVMYAKMAAIHFGFFGMASALISYFLVRELKYKGNEV